MTLKDSTHKWLEYILTGLLIAITLVALLLYLRVVG
jgi:hypothetical protein